MLREQVCFRQVYNFISFAIQYSLYRWSVMPLICSRVIARGIANSCLSQLHQPKLDLRALKPDLAMSLPAPVFQSGSPKIPTASASVEKSVSTKSVAWERNPAPFISSSTKLRVLLKTTTLMGNFNCFNEIKSPMSIENHRLQRGKSPDDLEKFPVLQLLVAKHLPSSRVKKILSDLRLPFMRK